MTGRRGWQSLVRSSAIVVHRWVGLVIAVFLIVAGLTGSMMAFFHDLDVALNPELMRVTPAPGAKLLDPIELRARIQQQLPDKQVEGVILELDRTLAVNYWIDDRETFADPYTGRLLGSREFGAISEGKVNLLTFLYRLHYSLALGDVGTWIFGAVALLWTIDCFVGAYLTFPAKAARDAAKPSRSWLHRWAPAWLVRTNRLMSLVFTWHRASGLWVWGLLLVFAWSAVALNLGDQVYRPVMNALLPDRVRLEPPKLVVARKNPKLDWSAARERGRQLMATQAKERGFQVLGERWLFYEPEHGAYSYTVESNLDIAPRLAETHLHFDGDDGRLLSFEAPTGQSVRGSVDSWLIALHFGAIREAGYAYRAFVCLLGLMVTLLSVTGIWIWWRKRRKRVQNRRKAGAT